MRKFFLIVLSLLFTLTTFLYFTPQKQLKYTTKELAKEADINPTLASFVLHTKVGRKVAYLVLKKKLKKKWKED